ncbi:hypothetical protein NPIL_186941 [Nephila pilipes]|uniref:Uncharacterized protein n=1 Tax=Nephila pilipes TaxID=299642 RepID=A0A8X6PIY2_NEPPI|nr:hypothetical protein NPIL_186941 [Nephila pilipes]
MNPSQADKTTRLSRPFSRTCGKRARNLSDNLHSPNPISIRELLCLIDYGQDRDLPDFHGKTPSGDQGELNFAISPNTEKLRTLENSVCALWNLLRNTGANIFLQIPTLPFTLRNSPTVFNQGAVPPDSNELQPNDD